VHLHPGRSRIRRRNANEQPDYPHYQQQDERAEKQHDSDSHGTRSSLTGCRLFSLRSQDFLPSRFWVCCVPITIIKRDAAMAGKYHAVSIRCAGNACGAAKNLRDARFLSLDAPNLPLADCTNNSRCKCRYRHYGDRRIDLRRDVDFGLPLRTHLGDERRQVTGRRSSDLAFA
jgi:hypothetical protein